MNKKIIHSILPAAFSIAAIILFFIPTTSQLLQFERESVANGELWRLFSCHLVHCSPSHLFWDVSTFMVLGIICCQRNSRTFIWGITFSALIISTTVMWCCPNLSCYRGLSGIDTAIYCWLALELCKDAVIEKNRFKTIMYSMFIVGLIGKTLYEFTTGSMLFSNPGDFIPVPLAHVAGIISGILIFTFKLCHSSKNRCKVIPAPNTVTYNPTS